jgi:hypothetical protein
MRTGWHRTVSAPSTFGIPFLALDRRIGAERFFDGSIGFEAFINSEGFKRAVRLAPALLHKT